MKLYINYTYNIKRDAFLIHTLSHSVINLHSVLYPGKGCSESSTVPQITKCEVAEFTTDGMPVCITPQQTRTIYKKIEEHII